MKNDDFQSKVRLAIEKLPRKHSIRSVKLFGSRLKGHARADSDIDLLVEFVSPVGLFELVRMEGDLSESLGADVDFITPKELSPYIRDEILASAETVYER